MTNLTRLKDVMDAEDNEWFSVRGKITQLRPKEDIHEKMEQEGYISDGTAEIRFVDWGDAPEFKEGEVYEFESVVTNKYRGNISISITSSTQFSEITEDDLFDGKPREQIIREIEQMGPKNKPYVDISKYRVNINDLKKNVEELDSPLWDIECNFHDNIDNNDSTPFWKKYSWESSLPPLTGHNTHTLSLYGINKNNTVFLGKKGSITGVSGSVGLQNRETLNAVKKLKNVADKLTGFSNRIIYDKESRFVKWMHLADCYNCGEEFDVEELIGVNPYNPSEKHLSYYDWWTETKRHNLDVPECPECGEKELYPPETPNSWHFIQKIPITKNDASIDDVENKIGEELDFNAKIRYTRDEILSLTMNNIVIDLSSEIQNAISDKKTKATGECGVRGITRRYIRLRFNRSLTEDELIEIANCAIKHGEGIGRIKKDNVNSMIIDLSFHENKSSED